MFARVRCGRHSEDKGNQGTEEVATPRQPIRLLRRLSIDVPAVVYARNPQANRAPAIAAASGRVAGAASVTLSAWRLRRPCDTDGFEALFCVGTGCSGFVAAR
jgi:hypothetical protein